MDERFNSARFTGGVFAARQALPADVLTPMIRPVLSRHLMNSNGPSHSVTNGASAAPQGAIVPLPAIKAVALRPLSHLMIWVGPEQCVRE